MKKIIGIGIAALMVMGLGVAAHASASDWLVYFKATDGSGLNGLSSSYQVGWSSTAGVLDGFDTVKDLENGGGTGSAVVLGSYDLGSGSNGTGYNKDIRPTGSTAFKGAWHMKLWLQANCSATSIILSAWNPTTTTGDIVPVALGGKNVTVKVNGQVIKTTTAGVADAAGTPWIFDGPQNGASNAPAFKWIIPDAQNYKGIANAMDIEVSVPEPGSIIAMLSGLVGLAGFGIRRKK